MITDLETLLNQDELKKLIEAVNNNQEYSLQKDGLTIKASSTDNSLQLSVSYDEENSLASKERKTFHKYLESIDDDLFISVCEYIGNSEIHKIQECLSSDNLETVRAGIFKFKAAIANVAMIKIEQLKQYV